MMNISKQALLILPGVSVGLIAWAQFSDGQTKFPAQRHQAISRPVPSDSGPVQFGDPLPGLTTDQLAAFGAGPDSAILQYAACRKADGITGRASLVQDVASGQQRVGRFGWKAQQATLLAFAGDAYLNEVGITSRLFPRENAPNGDTNLLAFF